MTTAIELREHPDMIELAKFLNTPLPLPEPLGPGIHHDVPMADYLALPYASNSRLSRLDRSPAHLRAYIEEQDSVDDTSSAAQVVGTAGHTAVLEPQVFARKYLRGPPGNWSHKAPKDEVAALRAQFPDCLVLKPFKFDAVIRARDSILTHPAASRLLARAEFIETTVIWDDAETGVRCKARPDVLVPSLQAVVDLKSAENASKDAFARAIAKYGYHRQGAHDLAGLGANGLEYKHHFLIAFEKEPPYAVAVYRLMDTALEKARAQLRHLLGLYKHCHAANHWPAYSELVEDIDVPAREYESLLLESV